MRSLSQELVSKLLALEPSPPSGGRTFWRRSEGILLKFLQVKFALVLVIIRVSVRFEQCVLQCTEKIYRNIVSQLKLQLTVRNDFKSQAARSSSAEHPSRLSSNRLAAQQSRDPRLAAAAAT